MGRKPVAYAPVSFAFLLERCSNDEDARVCGGQRPVSGHFNKGPTHNRKGIGGRGLLHLLTHCSSHAPVKVKDYRPAQWCITLQTCMPAFYKMAIRPVCNTC
jgi:hypothetical protein